jgi:hypothetical protein
MPSLSPCLSDGDEGLISPSPVSPPSLSSIVHPSAKNIFSPRLLARERLAAMVREQQRIEQENQERARVCGSSSDLKYSGEE